MGSLFILKLFDNNYNCYISIIVGIDMTLPESEITPQQLFYTSEFTQEIKLFTFVTIYKSMTKKIRHNR